MGKRGETYYYGSGTEDTLEFKSLFMIATGVLPQAAYHNMCSSSNKQGDDSRILLMVGEKGLGFAP